MSLLGRRGGEKVKTCERTITDVGFGTCFRCPDILGHRAERVKLVTLGI
jgi:hypothetical protein